MAKEQRLIDADKVYKGMLEQRKSLVPPFDNYAMGYADAIKMVVDAPTVDAVEVVRCKECKFAYINSFSAKQEKALCNRHFNHDGNAVIMSADDFCSYGERREGE